MEISEYSHDPREKKKCERIQKLYVLKRKGKELTEKEDRLESINYFLGKMGGEGEFHEIRIK